jgi:hypothetical protein
MGASKDDFMDIRASQNKSGEATQGFSEFPENMNNQQSEDAVYGPLQGFVPSRVDIERFKDRLRLAYESGDIKALDVMAKAKLAQKYLEAILGDGDKNKGITEIKEGARSEAEQYGASVFNYLGLEVTLKELGARWDFSGCGDRELSRLQAEMDILKRGIKEREEYLKSLKAPTEVPDLETGEMYEVSPPVKRSTSGLQFSLK